ncbi:MAG: ester cyclase [Caldilineaceae bacterium]
MNTETNKTIIHQMGAALERGDWAWLEQHPGLYETRQHFPHLLAAFPDLHQTFEQEVVAGEMITTVVTAHGTHQKEFLGIPATGKQVSFMVIELDRIVDGKIVEHWALPDFFGLLQQIGGVTRHVLSGLLPAGLYPKPAAASRDA